MSNPFNQPQAPILTPEQAEKYCRFGSGFLESVAKRVVNEEWDESRTQDVWRYANNLLLISAYHPDNPEGIKLGDANHVLDRFAYGLQLSAQHGTVIPEGFFVGQRLLAQRAAKRAKAKRRRQKLDNTQPKSTPKPRDPRLGRGNVVELRPRGLKAS